MIDTSSLPLFPFLPLELNSQRNTRQNHLHLKHQLRRKRMENVDSLMQILRKTFSKRNPKVVSEALLLCQTEATVADQTISEIHQDLLVLPEPQRRQTIPFKVSQERRKKITTKMKKLIKDLPRNEDPIQVGTQMKQSASLILTTMKIMILQNPKVPMQDLRLLNRNLFRMPLLLIQLLHLLVGVMSLEKISLNVQSVNGLILQKLWMLISRLILASTMGNLNRLQFKEVCQRLVDLLSLLPREGFRLEIKRVRVRASE